eukprot:493194_1
MGTCYILAKGETTEQLIGSSNEMSTVFNHANSNCDGTVEMCPDFLRLLCILQDYNQCDGNLNLTSILIENITDILNDYFHLMCQHDSEHEFEYISNTLRACNIDQCIIYKRNNQCLKRFYADKLTAVVMNILDKMHCYFMHSYDVGYRLTSSERHEIFDRTEIIEQKKECNDSFHYGVLKKLNTTVTNKRHKYDEIFSDLDGRNNLKCSQLLPTTNHSNELTKCKYKTYSFGSEFQYGFEKQKEMIMYRVTNKYDSLKEELTSNSVSNINIKQFNHEYTKAKKHLNSHYCKEKFFTGNEFISVEHILSFMIYCNYTQLQYEFSKTFRDDLSSKSKSEMYFPYPHKEEFYFLGYYLKYAVHTFGTEFGSEKDINSLYHGVSELLLLPECMNRVGNHVEIYCPLSTTSSFEVAANFTNENRGMIIQFFPVTFAGGQKYFSVSWLSDYAAEKEYFFIQNQDMIEIANIWDVSVNNEYLLILNSLKCINSITLEGQSVKKKYIDIDTNLELLVMAVIHDQLSIVDESYEQFESLTPFAKQMIDRYFNNVEDICINYKMMRNTEYLFLFDTFWNSKHQWINVRNVLNLFRHVSKILVTGIILTDFVFEDMVHCLKNENINHGLDYITILFERNDARCSEMNIGRDGVELEYLKEVGYDTKIMIGEIAKTLDGSGSVEICKHGSND